MKKIILTTYLAVGLLFSGNVFAQDAKKAEREAKKRCGNPKGSEKRQMRKQKPKTVICGIKQNTEQRKPGIKQKKWN
ncbi:MAG: hypothetical protein LUG51_15295 [Tannerellaceae bacterium]|nr:hypothetical protein [Tannerellaceae bacterium]